jgi:spermidine/putrescine-binding protein
MKFINFCLEPQNAADIINGTGYAGANQAAKPLVKPEILNDPAVYPPADVLNRCESIRQLGETAPVYDKLWGEIKGG